MCICTHPQMHTGPQLILINKEKWNKSLNKKKNYDNENYDNK